MKTLIGLEHSAVCEVDTRNTISAADIAFIMSSLKSA